MSDEIPTIDLSDAFWKEIQKAAQESPWIPKDHYYMNDWVSDICSFLRSPRSEMWLQEKLCHDIWLHVTAPSGLKASINLGERPPESIVQRTLVELCQQPKNLNTRIRKT